MVSITKMYNYNHHHIVLLFHITYYLSQNNLLCHEQRFVHQSVLYKQTC